MRSIAQLSFVKCNFYLFYIVISFLVQAEKYIVRCEYGFISLRLYIYIYLFCEKVQFFVTQNLYDNYRIIVLCDYTLMNRFLCGNICEEYTFFSQIPAFLIITISIILHEILKYYKLIFYFLPLPQYIVHISQPPPSCTTATL